MTKIGFIGLGIMGRPMARHLQSGGHALYLVRHRAPLPEELLAGGALECGSCKEVAERSDVIITMLPDTPDLEEVLFRPDGVAAGLAPGKTLIDMSTVSPAATRGFAARIEELGCDYLDAPVSGGEVGAKAASLSIMAGGAETVFQRVKPLFELMGSNITLVGVTGAGQTCKAANQILVALTVEAVGEALLFASKSGVDPGRVREALMGGFAGSKILEVHGERMIRRNFDPGFRIELHRKDLRIALEGAREMGIGLPGTAAVQELFNACAAREWEGLDHSALVRVLETLADHELG